jgi:tRNA (adenine22-N1)-methyltransferase
MIKKPYEHIWDCCCDHGLLGMKLLQTHANSNVHFVDIVAPLISQLEAKLAQYFSSQEDISRWQTYCQNVSNIALKESDSQLIIIAGVGGDKTIDFVSSILKHKNAHNSEFLLCPIHHNYKVRQSLKAMGFGLINEVLVKENDRFYELIHVSLQSTIQLSLTGSKMWDLSRNNDAEYLTKTIQHYLAKSKDQNNDVKHIVAAYQALKY